MSETWIEDETLAGVVVKEPGGGSEVAACVVHVSESLGQTRTRVLDAETLSVGRGSDCSLVIPVSHVSRVHAIIRRENGGWSVYDNESVNGIVINGIRRKHAQLSFGDRIDMGLGEVLLYRPYDSDYQRALEAQKLEALGRLASGVAHDFNNVLMAIVGAASGLRDDLKTASESLEDAEGTQQTLDDIVTATERGADLAGQLLSFAKYGSISTEAIVVESLVEEVIRLVGRTFDQNIEIATEIRSKGAVMGCRSQLSQVLMNLCINARDAMPHGGELRVIAEDCVPPEGASDKKFVRIRIRDTGVGMSPEVRERVFEPFFSTKGEGSGTGLGMATSYGVVRQYGGSIEIQSQQGAGTTVDIYLPAQKATRSTTVDTASLRKVREKQETFGDGRTILLAEDQALVRKHTSRLLKRMGFEVVECVDGVEAVEAVEAEPDRFSLAMVDLQMPRRSGAEACRMIRAIDPDLPLVIVSGNAEDERIEELMEKEDVDVLAKPYGVDALQAALSQAREDSSAWNGT